MFAEQQSTLPEIKHTVIIAASIQKVWETVSTSEGIASWFMPNDFQPIVGHEFHLQSPFGPSPCKVTQLEAPHLLSFIWDTDGWFVTFQLKEVGDKTEFTLIHGGWKQSDDIVAKAKENAAVIRERMDQGWAGIMEKLQKAVEG